jgi:hypothetical protein
MGRKLASIQKIIDIRPIKDADAIEVAQVLGWECVIAKKDDFNIGDLVVYIEIDSIMPEKPEYEFLRQRKFRVRTIRLRGQVSQGLVLPVSVLPKKVKMNEGEDVTDILGVRKYDPQAEIEERLAKEQADREKNKIKKFLSRYSWFRRLFTKNRGGFPSFISKTDEDRIQLFPDICEKERDTVVEITEKLDGQSGTWFLVRHKGLFGSKFSFGVCSRKVLLNRPDTSSYWQMAKKYNIENVLKNLIDDNNYVAIQGEICGEGIQGNKYGLRERDMWAFNLIYPYGKVEGKAAERILEEQGIKFVPFVAKNVRMFASIQEALGYSNGKSMLNPETLREGLVVRNYEKGLSFKVVSPEFLLKYGE